jgi:RluA family pseudouridine synthase
MPQIRLHKYMSIWLKEQNIHSYTSPEIKKNITNYGVLIDNKPCNNQLEWVYDNQKIQLNDWPMRELGDTSKIKIIYEDNDCMVINKPFGLIVEAGAGHLYDNVVQWLWENYPSQKFQTYYQDKELPASGLVHRLDKDTTGVLLIAKTPAKHKFLQDQFRSRSVVKKYLAIVDGELDQIHNITNWQSRDKSNLMRQRLFWTEEEALKFDPESRVAKSIITPKIYCPQTNQTLVQVQIKTGRMHQIRLQCEALGHPLTNCKIYNQHIKPNLTVILQNPKNQISFPANPIPTKTEAEFLALKQEIFGEQNYCLMSNYLELLLPSQKLAKFVIHEI